MITGELKSSIDSVWNDFWSGGISNPLEVMEQLTYLLFIKGLDERQTLAENKANRTGQPIEDVVFPEGEFKPDGLVVGIPYENMRWSRFKDLGSAQEMYDTVGNYVFPFLQERAANSTHAKHMKDARLTIPTPALLQKAVDGLDAIPMDDRDTKGDVYEYMLSKIASAGENGQFRTPRHIIQLMVEMVEPTPSDIICDPASGTCGFLVAAGEYIRTKHPNALIDPKLSEHFHSEMFHGYDFDNTMLRIGSMNMQLHGVQNPSIEYRDSLSEDNAVDHEAYSLVLANPPFAGSLDHEATAKDLQQVVRTKKTELLFLALFLRQLKPGGRAAVIVPDGVLFGSSSAHKELRRILVEDQKLDGVVSLPSGVFKPYAGVSTAILLFTKTNSGGTDHVWFYDVRADGFSLDDKRSQLVPPLELGTLPNESSAGADPRYNDLPDVLARWFDRDGSELERQRTDQSFCVPRSEIADNDYDLSVSRYAEVSWDFSGPADPEAAVSALAKAAAELQESVGELMELAAASSWAPDQGLHVALGDLLRSAPRVRAGDSRLPVLSMTMDRGLVDQGDKFKKRVASRDTSDYRVVVRGQLVVGFPIDEGVLAVQKLYPSALVSPAYGVWDIIDRPDVEPEFLEAYLRSPRALAYYLAKLRGSTARRRSLPRDIFLSMPITLPPIDQQVAIAAMKAKAEWVHASAGGVLGMIGPLLETVVRESETA